MTLFLGGKTMIWAPSDVIMHSQGPWKKHKYVKKVDGDYYYPNSYEDGRTVSDLNDDDVDKIADETISGKHGSGKDRKEKFGDDYARIQNRVNEKLGNKKRHEVEEEKDEDKDEEKKEESESEEKDKDEKDEDEKDSKKKKGSGKSKSGSSKKKGSSKSGKSSSGKSKSGKSGKTQAQIDKERRAKNKATITKRTEEQLKKKQERMRRNKLMKREYLNHSSFWAPSVTSEDVIAHSALKKGKSK